MHITNVHRPKKMYICKMAQSSRFSLTAAGVAAQMMPVPRRLSAACGTCVRYTADSPMLSCMDTDYEAVYETADNAVPRLLCENR